MSKILMIVIDGLGDRPIKELGNKTPLEAANTPNIDSLMPNSVCGMMYAVGHGIRTSSDVAHISIFGENYTNNYTGRGSIELLGLGVEMRKSDIAFRGNLAVVNDEDIIIDRRAGRSAPLREVLNEIREITN